MIRGSVFCCVLLGGLGLLLAAQAGVYKWTDDQGRVHYSDAPPAKGQAEQVKIRINSYTGPAVISKAKGGPAATRKEVVIYSTAWCGYCKKAKAFMDSRGVRYREVDVETDAAGKEEFVKLGGRGVPVILVGKSRMDGFSEEGLEGMLKAAGYPL